MCDNCDYDATSMHSDEKITTCIECKKSFITTTDALQQYALTRKDLTDVRHNTHKFTYKTNLFLIKDIEQIAIGKHGSLANVQTCLRNKQLKKEARLVKKEASKVTRKQQLIKHFRTVGAKYRQDSVLCENYINGSKKYTKEELADIAKEMEFFYDHTSYSATLNMERYEQRGFARSCGDFRWTDGDEECLRNEAKRQALEEYIESGDNKALIPRSLVNKYPSLF